MCRFFGIFWDWYERSYRIQLWIAAGLFSLQLVHLFWLTTDVVLFRIFGQSFFPIHNSVVRFFLVLIDYTEIPALITTSFVYLRSFKRQNNLKDILYLVFLNVQWLHIFWITDEVVLEIFSHAAHPSAWHPVAAWVAILIDYLELPVIVETIRRVFKEGFVVLKES